MKSRDQLIDQEQLRRLERAIYGPPLRSPTLRDRFWNRLGNVFLRLAYWCGVYE